MTPPLVLVIDDEPDLVKMLDYNLTKESYLVLSATDGETGVEIARKHAPDLIILDVMMPGIDGWAACRSLRENASTSAIPILMLTSKAEEADRVHGLELGADDYVTKPFSTRELLARVKALLRRSEKTTQNDGILASGDVSIDIGRRTVVVAGKTISLTTTEFNLLRALTDSEGRVISREDLITRARGGEIAVLDRTIDVHIAALRKKLGACADRIETVRGVGYRWRAHYAS